MHETHDAISIVFDIPPELADTFTYQAGQFVTLRMRTADDVLFRSYSMSSAPMTDEDLQVTVKRVPGGVVSNWLVDNLAEGDTLEVSVPVGRFVLTASDDEIVAVAGGSGVTPVFSIIKAALATTPRPARLLFANRDRSSAIFAPAIEDLAQRFADRFAVVYHDDTDRGFLTADDVRAFVGPGPADVYVCGPEGLTALVETTLQGSAIDPDGIHVERFTPVADRADPAEPPAASSGQEVVITIRGQTETVAQRGDSTILQSARWGGLRAPSSCESGHCASCMAMVVEGRVEMRVNDVLTPQEVAEGWILTCQAVPVTEVVRVVYDL